MTPAWDAERALDCCPKLRLAADDVVDALEGPRPSSLRVAQDRLRRAAARAGTSPAAWRRCCRRRAPPTISCSMPPQPRPWKRSRNAREATRIAELGYARLIEIARPGMSEDELAVELKWHTKTLGAEDNFLLLCARAAQWGGGAVERAHAAARRHHPGRDHAELPRTARADLPHRHAWSGTPSSSTTTARGRAMGGIAAARPGFQWLPSPAPY